MSEPPDYPLGKLAGDGMAKGRLEALTDAIVAVAMTLLVLDLKIDVNERIGTDAHLIRHLLEVERTFTVYLVSFAVLGMYWISHTLQFHYVRRVDRGLLWISLAFSLLITLIPFTTNVMISFETLFVPVVLYGSNQLLLSLVLIVNVTYLARRPQLAEAHFTPEIAAFVRRRLLLFAAVPLASIVIAWFNTRAALHLYFLMAILHFFPRTIDRRIRGWFRKPGA